MSGNAEDTEHGYTGLQLNPIHATGNLWGQIWTELLSRRPIFYGLRHTNTRSLILQHTGLANHDEPTFLRSAALPGFPDVNQCHGDPGQ